MSARRQRLVLAVILASYLMIVLDIAGSPTSALGMTALVYGLVGSADRGWSNPVTLIALAAGLMLAVGFAAAEQPVMPLRLFAGRERSGVAFLPTTVVNFAAALAVPRLTLRYSNARVLAAGLVLGVIGMAWLGRLTADSAYLTGVALPMLLIGAGQGGVLGPLTAAGLTGVGARDAGAASGVTNVAHQLGGSLGLGILVAVFAAAHGELAHRIATALTGGAVLLALALAMVLVFITRPIRAASTERVGLLAARRG